MSDLTRLDLRGTACPMNFIKIKIFLEQSGTGSGVRALVDADPVATDVCRSLESQGFSVLQKEEIGDCVEIIVCHDQDYP